MPDIKSQMAATGLVLRRKRLKQNNKKVGTLIQIPFPQRGIECQISLNDLRTIIGPLVPPMRYIS